MARRAEALAIAAEEAPSIEALVATIDRLTLVYDRWMRIRLGSAQGGGVTEARLKLLFLLQADGPQKMSALAKAAGVAARTLTTLVDGLEKEGLARRAPHSSDRRATLIELTAAGDAVAEANAVPYWGAKRFLMDDLSDDERRALYAVYDRWFRRIEDDLRVLRGSGEE